MNETFKLPSGGIVHLDGPDFAVCRDAEDLMELKYALSEKIIDIEMQIDLYEAGSSTGQAFVLEKAWDWLPRAKAALKWAKLYRDEAQNRQGRLANIEKQKRHLETERVITDLLRESLPAEVFHALISAATQVSEKRNGAAK